MSEVKENNVQIRERFDVDNDMKAEWCLSKIRKARKEAEKEKTELARQMKFYEEQMAMIDKQLQEEEAFFSELLKGYFQHRVDEGFAKTAKTKVSYKLPTGNLILKHREPEYKREPKTIIPWLKANGMEQFIKVKEELDWQGLKDAAKFADGVMIAKETVNEDGEIIKTIVPGVEIVEREDEFVVEVK